METNKYRLFPLGESALTVEFGSEIDEKTNIHAISLSQSIENDPFTGFIECVPAYSSVTVFFDPVLIRRTVVPPTSAKSLVERILVKHIAQIPKRKKESGKIIEVPVDFGSDAAPDLEYVAESNRLTTAEVIDIFTAKTYRVYMLGFLPGFPYMGRLDERISAPRLDRPRLKVPKGSVGIAGIQTGIYPLESPGGWRLIGRTDMELFEKHKKQPVLFEPGNRVRFVSA